MRALRSLALFELGLFAGLLGSAAFAKRALPSQGDADSEELALVAILDGIDFKSRAATFRGGSLLAWFGGIALDLRDLELAPGARLTVRTLFGGVALKVPPTWRIESKAHVLLGGIDVKTPAADDPDAPVLALDGLAVFGGIAIGGKAEAAVPAGEPAR
jgi:hypothetical protein